MTVRVDVDSPRTADLRPILEAHAAFTAAETPAEFVWALDIDGLEGPGIAFYSARDATTGEPLGVAALRALPRGDGSTPPEGELKSMHTLAAARGRGVGRALVDHVIAEARTRGYGRLSLETGSMDSFGPARSLYRGAGFVDCGPFGDYPDSPWSAFMTMDLAR